MVHLQRAINAISLQVYLPVGCVVLLGTGLIASTAPIFFGEFAYIARLVAGALAMLLCHITKYDFFFVGGEDYLARGLSGEERKAKLREPIPRSNVVQVGVCFLLSIGGAFALDYLL